MGDLTTAFLAWYVRVIARTRAKGAEVLLGRRLGVAEAAALRHALAENEAFIAECRAVLDGAAVSPTGREETSR